MNKYKLRIALRDGSHRDVSLFEVERITENASGSANMIKAYHIFPHVPAGSLERPSRDVDILIGQDYAALLSSGGKVLTGMVI